MLTERQLEIVTGSLLGAGTIWTNFVDPLMKWQFSQSKKDYIGDDKKTYLCWFVKEFIEIGCSVRLRNELGTGLVNPNKIYNSYTLCTRCDKFWNSIESKWYVPRTDHPTFKRRKIVPSDIKLSPLTLCIWYMDDGSNNQIDANIEINTQGFTVDEIEFLITKLKYDLNINSHKKIGGRNGQYKIYIGRDSYFEFIEIIKPHVEWDCFKYKIETSGYSKKPHRGESHKNSILTEENIKEIFKLRDEGMLQKEMSKKMGTTNISAILCGEHWRHLGLSREKIKKPRLTKEIKQQIIDLHVEGNSQNTIAKRLDINQSTVSRVVKGVKCQE